MKSKIEEKIEKAREATNEMFAAFDELNERLSAKIEPKFAEGEFVRTFDGYIFKVSHKTINTQKTEWLYCKNPNVTYFGNYIEESKLEKWMPKRGEYATIKYAFNGEPQQYICIIKNKLENLHSPYAVIDTTGRLHINRMCAFDKGDVACPSNQQERQLLDDKLKESGKRFDKEKLELVDIPKFKEGDWFVLKMGQNKDGLRWLSSMESYTDKILIIDKISENGNIINKEVGYYFHPDWCEKITAPKHKEPIIGEMAIMWDNNTTHAIGACFLKKDNNKFIDTAGAMWNNAILFESIEQYKKFINE